MIRKVCAVIALLVATQLAHAGLVPNDILVVYNTSPLWRIDNDPQRNVSELVANYYCQARGIPESNKLGLNWPYGGVANPVGGEAAQPLPEFAQRIYKPLMQHLQEHFGADPDDPASCRIKCIVLCYGIPSRITDPVRHCSVDAILTTLFEHAPWGAQIRSACA